MLDRLDACMWASVRLDKDQDENLRFLRKKGFLQDSANVLNYAEPDPKIHCTFQVLLGVRLSQCRVTEQHHWTAGR